MFSGVAAGGLTTTETATLTIDDNDTATTTIGLSVDTDTVMSGDQVDIGEDDGSETTVTVTATLAGSAAYTVARTVAVQVVSTSGAATPGGDATTGDYRLKDFADAAPSSVTLPISLGDITIPAGSLSASQTFKVNPNQDETSEGTETITVGGSACLTADDPCPGAQQFTVNSAALNLVDDDLPVIELSLNPDNAGEKASATSVRVTARRDTSVSSGALSVTVTVGADGSTATRGATADYTGTATGTINFQANAATAATIISIDPRDDAAVEGNETIVIAGQVGDGSTHSVTSATFTINDDDTASTSWTLTLDTDPGAGTSTSLDEPRNEAAESATSVTLTATLDGGTLGSAVEVTLSADATSTAEGGTGKDYTAATALGDGTVDITIAAGSTSGSTTIDITALHDLIDEGSSETIVIKGIAAGGLTTTETATLTIDDNDTVSSFIRLSAVPASINEGDSSTSVKVRASFLTSVSRSVPTEVELSGTLGGSATPAATSTPVTGDDFVHDFTARTITIPAGETSADSASFNITPNDDSVFEGEENIQFSGTACKTSDATCPSGQSFTVFAGGVRLTDDDLPPLTLSSATTSVSEADTSGTQVTVTASVEDGVTSQLDLTLLFAGTATEGTDYTLNPAAPTITIPNRQTTGSVTFTLTPTDDRIVEENGESIVIGSPNHVSYAVRPITIALNDDDMVSTGVVITLSQGSVALSNLDEDAGETTVTVTAELNDGELGSDVTVTFADLTGDADPGGVDYTAADADDNSVTKPAALTITAGEVEASTTIKITPNDDDIDEGTGENIIFGAALTGGLTGSATSATLRIRDNDSAQNVVNLSVSPAKVSEGHSGEATVTVTATVPGDKTHETATVVPVRVVAVTSPKRGATASADAATGDYRLKNFAGTLVSNVTLPITLGSITIPAGMSSATATFRVDPRDDSDFEGTGSDAHEYIRIGAGTVTGFTVNHADLELTENDNPTITITVDTSSDSGVQTSVPEGAGTRSLSVTLTLGEGARTSATRVAISFAGDAVSGTCPADKSENIDYSASTPTVSIPANQSSHTFSLPITVCDDLLTETSANETVTINGASAGFDVTGATITIDDNDSESDTLTISVSPGSIGEAGATRNFTVKATLNGGTVGAPVQVTFSAMTGAQRGADSSTGDYTSNPAKPATITIPSGSLSASTTISIDPRDDAIDENDEDIVFGASAQRTDNSMRPQRDLGVADHHRQRHRDGVARGRHRHRHARGPDQHR